MPAPERNPLGRFFALSAAIHVALALGLRVDVPRAREVREPVRVRVVDLVEPEEFLKRLSPREPEVLSRFSARASGRARPSRQPKLAASETRIPSPSGGSPAPSVAPQELRGIPLAALPRPGEAAPLPRPRALVEPVPRNLPPAPRARPSPSASALPAPPREGAVPRVAPKTRVTPPERAGPSPVPPPRRPPERVEVARVERGNLEKPAERGPEEIPRPAVRAPAPKSRARERASAPPARPPSPASEKKVEVARVEPSRPVEPAPRARPSDPLALLGLRPPSFTRSDLGKRPSQKPDLSLTPEDLAALPQQRRKEGTPADEGPAVSLATREFRYVSYFAHIKRRIEMAWGYPEEARRRGIAGKLMVKFVLREDGGLARLELLRSSGYPILDEEALSAIAKAAPFNPFPKTIRRKLLLIEASFEYVQMGVWRLR